MRWLTPEQRARVQAFRRAHANEPYLELRDLDAFYLAGHVSLDDLQALTALLTQCAAELAAPKQSDPEVPDAPPHT